MVLRIIVRNNYFLFRMRICEKFLSFLSLSSLRKCKQQQVQQKTQVLFSLDTLMLNMWSLGLYAFIVCSVYIFSLFYWLGRHLLINALINYVHHVQLLDVKRQPCKVPLTKGKWQTLSNHKVGKYKCLFCREWSSKLLNLRDLTIQMAKQLRAF